MTLLPRVASWARDSPMAAECLKPWPEHGDATMTFGRSDLSWDDSVRIDVRYVENWSLTFDLMILWKTVGAVLRGSGAY